MPKLDQDKSIKTSIIHCSKVCTSQWKNLDIPEIIIRCLYACQRISNADWHGDREILLHCESGISFIDAINKYACVVCSVCSEKDDFLCCSVASCDSCAKHQDCKLCHRFNTFITTSRDNIQRATDKSYSILTDLDEKSKALINDLRMKCGRNFDGKLYSRVGCQEACKSEFSGAH